MLAGEELAWEALGLLDPKDVCRRTKASFDRAAQTFKLKLFSQDVDVSLLNKMISAPGGEGENLLKKLRNHANLVMLSYLIHSSEVPTDRNLVNPADLAGGQIYSVGTHVLPLHLIAHKYGADRPGFINRGRNLGGRELSLAEASLLLFPLPLLSVAILLWFRDEEFPPRSVLLVDEAAGKQLPPDALWLTTMMCVEALL